MSVAIIMGSKSDLDIVSGAFDVLKEFNVPFTARILSAHRTPKNDLHANKKSRPLCDLHKILDIPLF